MTFVSGSDVVVILNGTDISPFCTSVEQARSIGLVDITPYGSPGRTHTSALTDGVVNIAGLYDTDDTFGPKALIEPLLGSTATMTYRPEGAAPGGPEQTYSVLVASYREVAALYDMIRWTAQLQVSGTVATAVTAVTAVADPYLATYTTSY